MSPDLLSPVLGNIFLSAGGVTTLGIRDLLSAKGDATLGVVDDSGVFRCSDGENFGIKLFLSPAEYDDDILGAGDLANGEGALLLPTGGVLGCGGGVPISLLCGGGVLLELGARVNLFGEGSRFDFDLCITGAGLVDL